jgi:hypothetical protein
MSCLQVDWLPGRFVTLLAAVFLLDSVEGKFSPSNTT